MKLIKLELKKMNLKPYLYAAFAMPLISLMFSYFLAFVPQFDDSVHTNDLITSHHFLYSMGLMINIAGFVCIGTALIGKIVIEPYQDREIYLTLSYPISRKKILTSKLLTCSLFCMIGLIISSLIASLIFFISESIIPISSERVTLLDYLNFLPMILVAPILVISIVFIALFIGWSKKSVALTVTAGIVLFSIPSNLIALGLPILIIVSLVLSVIALMLTFRLFEKLQKLEV